MASGIEILFKARLVREHWSQVFDDPASASATKFNLGQFQSVSAKQAIYRLKNLVGIDFDSAPAEKVFDLRNRVIHFAPSSAASARVVIASGLSFVATFLEEHLKPHLLPAALPAIEATQELINAAYGDLQDLAEKRMRELRGVLSTKPVVLECPSCFQFALVLTDDEPEPPKCLFCYFSAPADECAEQYAAMILSVSRYRSMKDGDDFPVRGCLECASEALVSGVALARRPDIHHACFACSVVYEADELDQCSHCGDFMATDDISICGECYRNLCR